MIKDYEKEYICLISEIYPNMATEWGIQKSGYNNFTKEGIEINITKLQNFSYILKRDKKNYVKKQWIIKNIELRIFELTELNKCLFSAYFFYTLTINTLIILFDDIVLCKYGLNVIVLEDRLKRFPDVIECAKKEMEKNFYSYFDLLSTIKSIQEDLIKLEKFKLYFNKNFYEEFEIVIFSIKKFLKFLDSKKQIIKKKFDIYSYGKDNIITYSKKISGLNVTSNILETFYQKACEIINKDKGLNLLNKNDKKILNFNKEMVKDIINEIYTKSKDVFGVSDNIIKSLKIIEGKENLQANGSFYYVSSDVNKNIKGYLFYSSKYNQISLNELKLKIVHEIYPGHHFMRLKREENGISEISNLIAGNIFMKEGWAKFCEFYYSYYIENSETMINSFNCNLGFMAIMYIITMDIHYYEKDINNILDDLYKKLNLKKIEILTFIINANRYPMEYLSYFLGYNYFANKKEIQFKNLVL